MNIGIIGATGSVGEELIKLIEKNHLNFDIQDIKLFASNKSAGKIININNKKYTIQILNDNSFENLNVAIFCASTSISKKYASIANNNGCKVIDNSSAFRMNKDTPLVIPEVNGELVKSNTKIIANPNCCTALLCIVLSSLHNPAPHRR